jgi:class 3 adenylate cyclase
MDTTTNNNEQKPDRARRAAHVLCVNIVGFSTLSVHDARMGLADLRRAVLESAEYIDCQLRNEVLCHMTGEGVSIIFLGKALSPSTCAIQLTRDMKDHPLIKLRMGIHSGPVFRNREGQLDAASEGLVVSQRVAEIGDPGHILLSGSYYDNLGQMMIGYLYLTELGEIKDRHSNTARIYNMRDAHQGQPEFGNALVPHKMRVEALRSGAPQAAPAAAARRFETVDPPAFSTMKLAVGLAAALLIATLIWRVASPTSFAQYQARIAGSLPGAHRTLPGGNGPVAGVGAVGVPGNTVVPNLGQ